MDFSLLITILGSFISLLLMINAHFTRKTLEKISLVELQLAVLIQKHDATDERSRDNKSEIASLKEKLCNLETIFKQGEKK